jgi:MinD-like ATPase involved in chromosome partitioning or flagellar assembly
MTAAGLDRQKRAKALTAATDSKGGNFRMNLYMLSPDRQLLKSLRLSGEFKSVVPVSAEMAALLLMEAEERGGDDRETRSDGNDSARKAGMNRPESVSLSAEDVWLVSDTMLDIHEAVALRGLFPDNKFIYLLGGRSESGTFALKGIQTMCTANEMQAVLPYRTSEQAAADTIALCTAREKAVSRVITVIGALPQTGLTSSLLGIGTALAQLSGIRVGILGMNGWNPGDSGVPYTGKYLDELWGGLQGKQLQAAELRGRMQQLAPGVHYLAGSRDLKKLYYYQIDGASWLIEKAREIFDVVLIDAGSYPDHALAAQSIHAADLLLVQLHQSQQAKAQWRRMKEHILQPVFQWDERQTMILFNQMRRIPSLENEKQLSRQLGMPYIGSLPYVPDFYESEAEGALLKSSWPDYSRELRKIGRAIIHYYGLPLTADKERQSSAGPAPDKEGRTSWFGWLKPGREAYSHE